MFCRSFLVISVACLSSVQLAPGPFNSGFGGMSFGNLGGSSLGSLGSSSVSFGQAVQREAQNHFNNNFDLSGVKTSFDNAGQAIANTANNAGQWTVNTANNAGQTIVSTANNIGSGISNYDINNYECLIQAGSDINKIAKCRNNAIAPCPTGSGEGIDICPDMTTGDNTLGTEQFLQENEHTENTCEESCKKLHPFSAGVTESKAEQYPNSGKNKCWCEYGCPVLDSTQSNYQTCKFA